MDRGSWHCTGIKTSPKKKKFKKAKWLSEEALQVAVKRREAESKGERERYTHLNAEFQRIARRDKRAFISDQCKEIEKNNRMGKTRDLNLPVTWLLTFAFPSSVMKWHLFWVLVPWVLVLKGLVGLHRTVQLQLLQRYWLGHRLGSPWYWMENENEQRSFCRFWDYIQVLHFRLFCWPWWLLHFF